MTTISRARPVLLSPTARHPADAARTTFSWSTPDADRLRFQVSTDRSFTTLLWDEPVPGLTQLTLEKALPHINETYYWRVGCDGAWSAPAAFVGTTDEDAQQWEWARAEAQARIERDARRDREKPSAATPPARLGTTSRLEAALWISAIVLSFALVLSLLITLSG